MLLTPDTMADLPFSRSIFPLHLCNLAQPFTVGVILGLYHWHCIHALLEPFQAVPLLGSS